MDSDDLDNRGRRIARDGLRTPEGRSLTGEALDTFLSDYCERESHGIEALRLKAVEWCRRFRRPEGETILGPAPPAPQPAPVKVGCPCCRADLGAQHLRAAAVVMCPGCRQRLERRGRYLYAPHQENPPQGGFGVVYRGVDVELGRRVALKVLREGELNAAFWEARVSAEMRHPGIVRAHEVLYADGPPVIVTDLIEGPSLGEYLREHGRLPANQAAQIVQQAATALDYAHAMGYLHCDLKPANILLEIEPETPAIKVLLADFGLAIRDEAAAAGRRVGTPLYMSPEAVAGKKLEPRSDVYSLGLILWELLAGREAVEQFQKARLDRTSSPPTLPGPPLPPALAHVCTRALARDPERRYPSAHALAEDLRHWRRDEPIDGFHGRWSRLRLWRRREPWLVASLAGLAAVLLLLFAAGGAAVARWSWQSEQAREGVGATLAHATELRRQFRWAESRRALELASRRGEEEGLADQRERIRQARADLEWAARLDEISLKHSLRVGNMVVNPAATRAAEYGAIFREAGLEPTEAGPSEMAARIRQSAIWESWVAALDEWAAVTNEPELRSRLLQVAREADPDEWRDRLRDPNVWVNRAALEGLVKEVPMEKAPPQLLNALATFLDRMGGDSVPLLRAAVGRYPENFWMNFTLGSKLSHGSGATAEQAVGYLRAALVLRPANEFVQGNLGGALCSAGRLDEAAAVLKRAIENAPSLAGSSLAGAYSNLGRVLDQQGHLEEASAAFEKAIAIEPGLAAAHSNLGIVLKAKGRLDDALAAQQKAVELAPDLAQAHTNLGVTLQAKGLLDNAIRSYNTAIHLDPRVARTHAILGGALDKKGQYDEGLAACEKAIGMEPTSAFNHINYGVVLAHKGRHDDALAAFQKAVWLDSGNAYAHGGLGAALLAKGRVDEAIAALENALRINPRQAEVHSNLGTALARKGRLDDALVAHEKAVQVEPKSVAFRVNLANTLRDLRRFDEAIAAYEKALEMDREAANAHIGLGIALARSGRLDEAIAALERGIQLAPRDAKALANLGTALGQKGRYREARSAVERAIRIDPKSAHAHLTLGNILAAQRSLDEAAAAYDTAIQLDRTNASAYRALGQILLRRGRFSEARAALQRWRQLVPPQVFERSSAAGELKGCEVLLDLDQRLPVLISGDVEPRDVTERLNVASLCRQPFKRFYANAVRFYVGAFSDKPRLAGDLEAGHRFQAACAAALAAAGKGEDAGRLSETERARLRQKALDWLREDLGAWATRAGDRAALQRVLGSWRQDCDLADVREEKELAKLPADERVAWKRFWADVSELLEQVLKTP